MTPTSPPTTRPPRLKPEEIDLPERPFLRRLSAPDERPEPVRAPKPSRRSSDGRVVVDSRLRARRVEVRIDEGRRRLRRVIWAGGVAVLLVALAGLTQSPLLAVRHLRVVPARHTSVAEIERVAGIAKGRAMISTDTSAAAARLRRLPWVRTASVTRQWPTTVRISVTERIAAAQIGGGHRWILVDGSGRALAQVAGPTPGLTRLVGLTPTAPGATVAGSAAALRLVVAMPDSVRPLVAWVEVDRSGSLALRITTGGKVVVGSLSELDAKMVALATMLGHVQPHSFCTIDVQVPNAPTLTRASACA